LGTTSRQGKKELDGLLSKRGEKKERCQPLGRGGEKRRLCSVSAKWVNFRKGECGCETERGGESLMQPRRKSHVSIIAPWERSRDLITKKEKGKRLAFP